MQDRGGRRAGKGVAEPVEPLPSDLPGPVPKDLVKIAQERLEKIEIRTATFGAASVLD